MSWMWRSREGSADLAVPETPADPLDGFDGAGTCLAIARRGVRPAFGRLRGMRDPHRKMTTVQHVMRRTEAGRFGA
jgi:hypothetical protein